MSDIVKLYNPVTSATLTPEQIEGLQKLTTEEIKELAKAYPNTSMQKAFLLIVDGAKPVNKQIPTLSTFENLYNLKVKNGLKTYVALNFKGNYKPRTIQPVRAKRSEVLDLSDTELLTLPGFRTGNQKHKEETIEVTKILPKVDQAAVDEHREKVQDALVSLARQKPAKKTAAKKSATKSK